MENNHILWKLVSSHHHSHITIIYNHSIDHHHEILQTNVLVWLLIISVTICLCTTFLYIDCKERPVTMFRTAYQLSARVYMLLVVSCLIFKGRYLNWSNLSLQNLQLTLRLTSACVFPNIIVITIMACTKKTFPNWVLWTLKIIELIHSLARLSTLNILAAIFLMKT